MEQITNSTRCCATCEYWLGYREPSRLSYLTVSSRMAKGQCSAHSLSEHYERQAVYCCSNYCKWRVLR